ncbi:MAG: hypothetical protein AABY11_04000, partial [archaeon]
MPDENTPKPATRWAAIFIVGLMLLSGVAVFFAAGAGGETPTPGSSTVETFIASDITGEVTTIFPTAIIGGQTLESDKTVIDEIVLQLSFVEGVNSQFTRIDTTSSELAYLATVSLSAEADRAAFVEAVSQVDVLSNVEVYFQASASVPSTMTGQSQAGVSKTFTLSQPIVQAIISPQTQVGDSIVGSVSATFQGEIPVSAYMVESQNLARTPVSLSKEQEVTIDTLENRISATGVVTFTPSFSGEWLQTSLSALPHITNVETPILPFLDRDLVAIFPNAESVKGNVQLFMVDNPNVFTDVQASGSQLVVTLGDVSLVEAKTALKEIVEEALS